MLHSLLPLLLCVGNHITQATSTDEPSLFNNEGLFNQTAPEREYPWCIPNELTWPNPLYKDELVIGVMSRDFIKSHRASIQVAIHEINNRNDILPNHVIQLRCVSISDPIPDSIYGSIELIGHDLGTPVNAIIGPFLTDSVSEIQYVIRDINLPQVIPILSFSQIDLYDEGSTMVRMAMSSEVIGEILFKIVSDFGWLQFATLSSANDESVSEITSFLRSAEAYNDTKVLTSQTYFFESLEISGIIGIRTALGAIKSSGARIIVYTGSLSHTTHILAEADNMGMLGKPYVWIGTDRGMHTGNDVIYNDIAYYNYSTSILNGLLYTSRYSGFEFVESEPYQRLVTSLDTLNLDEDVDVITNIPKSPVPGSDITRGLTSDILTNGVLRGYDSTYLVATAFEALSDMIQVCVDTDSNEWPTECDEMAEGGVAAINLNFLDLIKQQDFLGASGVIKFKVDTGYRDQIILLKNIVWDDNSTIVNNIGPEADIVIVGEIGYDREWSNKPDRSAIVWPKGFTELPIDAVIVTKEMYTFDGTTTTFSMGMMFAGISLATIVIIMNIYNRKVYSVKASSWRINIITCVGAIVSLLAIMYHKADYSVETYTMKCKMKIVLISSGFVLLFTPLFAKTYRIHTIYKSNSHDVVIVTDMKLLGVVMLNLALHLAYLLVWLLTASYSTIIIKLNTEVVTEDLHIETCIHICDVSYGYMMWPLVAFDALTIVYGVYLSFNVRYVTMNELNDSKENGACIYVVTFFAILIALIMGMFDENPGPQLILISLCTFVLVLTVLVISSWTGLVRYYVIKYGIYSENESTIGISGDRTASSLRTVGSRQRTSAKNPSAHPSESDGNGEDHQAKRGSNVSVTSSGGKNGSIGKNSGRNRTRDGRSTSVAMSDRRGSGAGRMRRDTHASPRIEMVPEGDGNVELSSDTSLSCSTIVSSSPTKGDSNANDDSSGDDNDGTMANIGTV